MKKTTSDHLTAEQKAELEALAALPDDQIQTDDIPEVRDWHDATRLDADLIEWFKKHHPKDEGYQTSINRVLREYVAQQNS
jgi:uncharacterized protein (DUF4415 family)